MLSTSITLCDLPEELLVHILAQLGLRDLLNCAQTCRLLHTTVADTVSLQYNIQLAIGGMQDCGAAASRLNVAERLAELQARLENCRRLRFRGRRVFAVPRNFSVWELCGGIFSHGLRRGSTVRGLAFVQFPSACRGVEARVWEHKDLGVHIRDYTFDPGQDIAVVVAKPRGAANDIRDRQVYAFAMSNGIRHPLAASVPLTCVLHDRTDPDGDFVIQIMADFVAVLFHARDVSLRDQLFIWNWKTGDLLINFMIPGRYKMDSFAFISPRHFLISRIEHGPLAISPARLQIYDFLDGGDDAAAPSLVRSFLLPQQVSNAVVVAVTIRSDPAPRAPWAAAQLAAGAPFCTGPAARLLVVGIVLIRPGPNGAFFHTSFQLFVSAATLLAAAAAPSARRSLPWDAWGPAHTRMCTSVPEFPWVCYVHGTRFVTLDQWPDDRGAFVRMLDFNALLVRRAQSRPEVDEDDGEEPFGNSQSRFRVVSASEPTLIPGGHGFRDAIETSLPYCEILGSESFGFNAVMIDEECLVGIGDSSTDGCKNIEVLCF